MNRAEFEALENAEFDAFFDLWKAAPRDLLVSHTIQVRDVGPATCLTSRLEPAAVLRRAVRVGVGRGVTEFELDDILACMKRLGLPYAIPVAPFSEPPALESWLEERGFTRGRAWMKFCHECDAAPTMAAGLDVKVVGPEMGSEFGRIIAQGFQQQAALAPWMAVLPGRAGWVCVMGFRQGEPVAAGALFMSGEHAWLGLGTTLKAHRRQGAQAALLARRLSEARDRGARRVVTEVGERTPGLEDHSYRNALRAGFREMYLRQNYISPPP